MWFTLAFCVEFTYCSSILNFVLNDECQMGLLSSKIYLAKFKRMKAWNSSRNFKYHHKGYSMNYKDTSQNGSLCILDLEWHIIILTEWQACLWNILNDVFLFNWSKMLYRKSSRFQFRFLFMYIRAQLICSDCMWEELLAQYQDTCIIHHTLHSL